MVSERYKEFYVSNITDTQQIITLYLYNPCDNSATPTLVEGSSQVVPAQTEVKVEFPADGTYDIVIDGDSDNGTLAKYYLTLFSSFITYTSAALCGDGTCIDTCSNTDDGYVANALAKAVYYMAVNGTKYSLDIDAIMANVKCSAAQEWTRITNNEAYLGKTNIEYLAQIELAHYYKSFRNTDVLTELSTGIDDIYDYEKINSCIKKLGITDCGDTTPLPGTKHTTTMSVAPTTLGLGVSTSITVSYKFTENDDLFTEIVDTNIPNVTINKLDGFTQQEIILGQTTGKQYFITYKYSRGGQIYQNTISVTTTAYAPQWYGGESNTAKFNINGQASAATIKTAILNIQPVYKATASGTSNNTDTNDKYIWWIVNAPVRFFIGAFEIQTGNWNDSCDPNSYAIIYEVVPTLMEDNITIQNLYYYRTCPKQTLTGQTLSYTLTA